MVRLFLKAVIILLLPCHNIGETTYTLEMCVPIFL